MDVFTIALLFIAGSVVLMIMGIPVAYALGFCAVAGLLLFWGWPAIARVGMIPFSAFYNLNWTPVPLFVLMACIIGETQIGMRIFEAANRWLGRMPGGLIVASVWAEAAMAATMGASGTTLITVGRVSLPQMERLGYDKKFSTGAVLAGGVLGPLIPPSIPLIIYAMVAGESITRLLIAGVVPGIILAVLLSVYVVMACLRRPELAHRGEKYSWVDKLASVKNIWPVAVLIVGLLGGIYGGVMTATEAGGIGVLIILLVAVISYRFRVANLIRAMSEAAKLTAMIGLMIIAAVCFSYLVGASGLGPQLYNLVAYSGLSRWAILIIINLILLGLGFVMDGLAIMLVTVPLFIPLIRALGFDPVWFGIMMVVNIEIGLITPPMAFNLYLTSGTFGMPVSEVIRGVAPFLVVLFVFLAIVIAFPQLSLWLPSTM